MPTQDLKIDKTTSDVIYAALRSKRMTLTDFAAVCKYTPAHLSRVFNGHSAVSPRIADKMRTILDIDIDERLARR